MPTILHLSDLQFGKHHRFNKQPSDDVGKGFKRYEGDEAYNTLLGKLVEDIVYLKDNHDIDIDIVVISGDLAEWSIEDEYHEVERFLMGLIKNDVMEISRECVILVPGNHDVNWDICEALFLIEKPRKRTPSPPYISKFDLWFEFFNRFYQNKWGNRNNLWYPYDLSKFGCLIVGLNSCFNESHLPEHHYGSFNLEYVNEAIKWFDKVDPEKKKIRIVVLHHNLLGFSDEASENLKDGDVVHNLLIDGKIDIVLHGHRHYHQRYALGIPEKQLLYVLGSGSAGLDSETLPDCPNQYQIIDINDREITLYLRRYDSKIITSTGRGGFVADSDKGGKWIYKFSLPKHGLGKTDVDKIRFDTYIDSAYTNVLKELKIEENRVGKLLKLDCSPLDIQQKNDLLATSIKWLTEGPRQFVLLGDAGSGKSVFGLQFASKCFELYQNGEIDKIPILIDLKRYAEIDSALQILSRHFREHDIEIPIEQIRMLLKNGKLLIILDSFDEYDKGSLTNVSDRPFESFEYLCEENNKLLITCRTTFFKRPKDIYLYDLKARGFELCPNNALLQKINPLQKETILTLLEEYMKDIKVPDWLLDLASRPLFLRMIVPLIKTNTIDFTEQLRRHQLYSRYIDFLIGWDVDRRKRYSSGITATQSLSVHTSLSIQFLNHPSPSISITELSKLLCKTLGCRPTNGVFEDYLQFFQLSSLLQHDNLGRMYFAHKSFREYLVARHIYDEYLSLDDDSFDWIWFTRNEREFLSEMITEKDINVLRRWLKNEKQYPACNYAAFILGGLNRKSEIRHLRQVFDNTKDSLVKLNCINSITFLGDNTGNSFISGIVAGYLLSKSLITVLPIDIENDALGIFDDISNKFNHVIALLHLCESIEALSICGDEDSIPLMKTLQKSDDKCVVDEATISLRNLINKLGVEELNLT